MKALSIFKVFFGDVKDMKIKNHPAFADDTQNKIDYIDELVKCLLQIQRIGKIRGDRTLPRVPERYTNF